MRYNTQAHDEYIKSGSWKCDKSPTGAHHFIGNQFVLKCKYCGKEKQVMEYVGPMQEKRIEVARRKGNAL